MRGAKVTLADEASPIQDRVITLGRGLAPIPERLLLAHARGEVLFVCGAGISKASKLPDFRELVIEVYAQLDSKVHAIISHLPIGACNQWETDLSSLNDPQKAEVKRFIMRDYDVVLGMLERRLDQKTLDNSRVRQVVAQCLNGIKSKPAPLHRALMKLADRGGASTIVTTNFDLLLEKARNRTTPAPQCYSLGSIPRPTRQTNFSGVLHIHGALDNNPKRSAELVLSDQDFGEFYLRRRVVPDFIYDAARLFHIVLIGYSANDPPMRYLLNAVAADGSRFDDLKERFTFTSQSDPVDLEDWKARGITPIHYPPDNGHASLCQTLERWAELSAINGKREKVESTIRKIVKAPRMLAPEHERDLFDHLIRREDASARDKLIALVTNAKADIGWLDATISILSEKEREVRP